MVGSEPKNKCRNLKKTVFLCQGKNLEITRLLKNIKNIYSVLAACYVPYILPFTWRPPST